MRQKDWDRLNELTAELCNFTKPGSREDGKIEYEAIDKQTITGYGLVKDDMMAIQKAFFPKGSILAKHAHEATEWLIVYEGKGQLETPDGITIMDSPERGVCLASGVPHKFTALTDLWILGLTFPPNGAYPDVKGGVDGE